MLTLLSDPEWAEWSDRTIAEVCGVTHPFVAGLRRPEKVVTVTTSEAGEASAKPSREAAPEKAKRKLSQQQEPADDDRLAEAQHAITDLAQENEQLRDRLAVESLMEPEDAKNRTIETIRELREQVKTMEAENAALMISRDTY